MNLFELFVKIGVDDQASGKIAQLSDSLKTGLATAAKVGVAAVTATSGAVLGLAKKATDAYGSFEQLKGGVETLFGKSAPKVLKNADRAFTTAGMSANKYMETAITGAAALINSLEGDTEEAARLMDISIQDMSDNVNKMGTTMESVLNAYRGFSRQNFTMLDNLALGYSGSKKGMEELLVRAEQLQAKQGVLRDYSVESYADIVEAIHVVQQEMGITGTTAEEASGTITGSLSSVKAAWENVLVAISSGENIGETLSNLGETALAFAGNYFPRIQQSITGIFDALETAIPQIVEKIPDIIQNDLPQIIQSATSIITKIVETLTDPSSLTMIMSAAMNIIGSIGKSIIETVPTLLSNIGTSLSQMYSAITAFFHAPEQVSGLVQSGKAMLQGVIDGIKAALDWLIPVASDIVKALADGIPKALSWLISAAGDLITQIGNYLGNEENRSKLIDAAGEIVSTIGKGITDTVSVLGQAAVDIITGLADFLQDEEKMTTLGEAGGALLGKIISGITDTLWKLGEIGWDIVTELYDYFVGDEHAIEKLGKSGENILKFITSGAESFWEEVKPTFESIGEKIGNVFKLDIDWQNVGKTIIEGIKKGYSDAFWGIIHFFESIPEEIGNLYEKVDWKEIGKSTIHSVWDGIKWQYNTFLENGENFVDWIKGLFETDWIQIGKDIWDSVIGGIKSAAGFVGDIAGGIWEGVTNFTKGVWGAAQSSADATGSFASGIAEGFEEIVGLRNYEETGTADALKRFKDIASGGVVINQNIYAQAMTPSELENEALFNAERALVH